ncbi:unnamed protein product [Dibothriocephalus latus]|uniref:Uncharacterized protein n=1 Tax=Dibothriocephalus latus TaxID=60516 RepID=A0A3P6S848_DIBLA|nr:unnamed protein product [Dibothriocephalus latus]
MPKKGNELLFTSIGAIALNAHSKTVSYVTQDEISRFFQVAVQNEGEQTAVIIKGSENCLTLHLSSKERPLVKLAYDGVVQLKRDDVIQGLVFLQYTKNNKTSIFVLLISDPSTVTALEESIQKKNKSAILWSQACEA